MFDPNTWDLNARSEFRIYGNNRATIFAVVDEEDYQHCLQWLWLPKKSRGGKKVYLKRNLQEGVGRLSRTLKSRYLHTEIMLRAGVKPPSELHTIVDHMDGDGMNCRRSNLRWATPKENRHNRHGSVLHGSLF